MLFRYVLHLVPFVVVMLSHSGGLFQLPRPQTPHHGVMDVHHNLTWIFKVVVPRDGTCTLLQCIKSSTHKQRHHRRERGWWLCGSDLIRSNLPLWENILLRWRPIKGFRFNCGAQTCNQTLPFPFLYSLLRTLLTESSLLVFIFLGCPESWK